MTIQLNKKDNKESREFKKGGFSNAWGVRNTLPTIGAAYVRKSFLDMLKSRMWQKS